MKKKMRIRIKNKDRISALIVCFLLAIVLVFVFTPSSEVNGKNIISYTEYTVKDGDTLWDIASNMNNGGMDIREIVFDINQLNEYDANNVLRAGETIKVPVYAN